MTLFKHTPEILLVEDREEHYRPTRRFLERENYHVTIATDLASAVEQLDSKRFHLAIVDIHLSETNDDNEDGLLFLKAMAERGLSGVLGCIVLTSKSNERRLLEATQVYRVDHYLLKDSFYLDRVVDKVEELFREKICINFDLDYQGIGDPFLSNLASHIRWEEGPPPETSLLVAELHDLFGRLFRDAASVFLTEMQPGLTGAALVRVRPTWEHGPGPSYALKISRREKVAVEEDHYRRFVEHYIPANRIDLKADYARHLGILQYTFVGGDVTPFQEFDVYYEKQGVKEITDALHQLFEKNCRFWYRARRNAYCDLPGLYLRAFDIEWPRLVRRIQDALPEFELDETQPGFTAPPFPFIMTNPLHWLARRRETLVMQVSECITHGDLTGRNIMVTNDGDCWLIDFYRTYQTHILRDFVILETDIKYRLMPQIRRADFLALEEYLLQPPGPVSDDACNAMSESSQKAALVLESLRERGREYARRPGATEVEDWQEYLLSLLMATLNVIRLRHIPLERKRHALFSAALICDKLDVLQENI